MLLGKEFKLLEISLIHSDKKKLQYQTDKTNLNHALLQNILIETYEAMGPFSGHEEPS